ncbi:MAG: hypothetical protein AB7P20_10490 [Rhizobiaceae bacterium]
MRPHLALRAASKRCSYPLALFLRGEDLPSPAESWTPYRHTIKRRDPAQH